MRSFGLECQVKGHAKDSDVRAGSVQPIDKWGNDGVDQLAVACAEMHAAPCDFVNKCERRATAAHAAFNDAENPEGPPES